ncbi:hypothetical protein CLOM_g3264 [Closterium sp. NIES-68]|nr:hypothetical protein CLOM_g3264 [Closterium sp. NIES-68]GJP82900.1 hypothetical protein CLOP_g13123 [Closterium sp. NIES-67]
MPPLTGRNLLLEEPIRLASILESSLHHRAAVPSLTKVVGTVGGRSRSVEALEALLRAGMTVARFDFSHGGADYQQHTLDNLRAAMRRTKKLCAVMLDTVGAELMIANPGGAPIALAAGHDITLSPSCCTASASCLPISFHGLAQAVRAGDEIFVGQYLFTGTETTSVWLQVQEARGADVVCSIRNSTTLAGPFFTAHAARVRIDIPTLTAMDRQHIATWGRRNNVDIISLSFTRHPDDVAQARALLRSLGDLEQTQIYAKIENMQGLQHVEGILEAADGIILSRGNLGIDLPPEKVFGVQKRALALCNLAGKPAVITRVVDSMVDAPRPTRAEATDVANAVLDGADALLLGAETLRGLYPAATVETVGHICAQAERVFNHAAYFKSTLKAVPDPMSHLETICASAVRTAEKVRAAALVVFTSSGHTARLVCKYKPSMPVLALMVPRVSTNQLSWHLVGPFQAHQCLAVRGLFPILADVMSRGGSAGSSTWAPEEALLQLALERGQAMGVVRARDRVIVVQKLRDAFAVRIVEAFT